MYLEKVFQHKVVDGDSFKGTIVSSDSPKEALLLILSKMKQTNSTECNKRSPCECLSYTISPESSNVEVVIHKFIRSSATFL